MFLNRLNEEERVIFLNLANLAIMVDNEATKKEDELLFRQIHECGVANFAPKFFNLDRLLKKLECSSIHSKKVIMIELMAVWAADDRWDNMEIEMMEKIGANFGFDQNVIEDLKNWSIKMKDILNRGLELLE